MSSPNPHADPENTKPNLPFAKKRMAKKMRGANAVRHFMLKKEEVVRKAGMAHLEDMVRRENQRASGLNKAAKPAKKSGPSAGDWKKYFSDRAADKTPVHLRKWGAQDPKNPKWKH